MFNFSIQIYKFYYMIIYSFHAYSETRLVCFLRNRQVFLKVCVYKHNLLIVFVSLVIYYNLIYNFNKEYMNIRSTIK